LIAYFVVYIVYQSAVLTYFQASPNWLIYSIELLYNFLLFLPVFFYRKTYGWLHPLIFPLIFSLLRKIGANPELLLGIFYPEQLSEYYEISHILFYDWRHQDLEYVYVQGQIINIVAVLSYYLGYFYMTSLAPLKINFGEPVRLKGKILTLTVIGMLVFFVYLQFKGGITNHLLSWAQGRFNALAGDGPIFVMVKTAPLAVLIWYAFDDRTERNPFFWIVLISVIPLQFILTGSRSSIVYLGTLFLLITIWKKKKIPGIRVVLFGAMALVLIGFLGNIRSSTFKGNIEWASLLEFNFFELVEDTQEEMARRSESNGYLAVIGTVPEEVDHLYGESYIGTLLFFIPRYFWAGKPRGAGAISGERIFRKSSGAGIPPGPVGEAYWNFSVFGVILVFIAYGVLHKWLATNMMLYHSEPGYFIFYIITLTIFVPTGIAIVSYVHAIIPVLLILKWLKVI